MSVYEWKSHYQLSQLYQMKCCIQAAVLNQYVYRQEWTHAHWTQTVKGGGQT